MKDLYNIILEEAMIKLLVPENKELETEAVTSFHWHIDDWKNLETKCHSPPFELYGYEW